jgi:hypothetical protein
MLARIMLRSHPLLSWPVQRLLSGDCERVSKALALAEGERNDLRLETERSSR